jgi:glycosyltransferase involved in cell wall biosynthesis
MDVYADNLISELKIIRPDWEIIEISPQPWSKDINNLWHSGNPLRKYYERFFNHPRAVINLEADIFHIIDHTNGHIAYWLKKLGKPVVITCHDLVQYIYPEILKKQSRFPALSMAIWQYSVKGITVAEHTITVSTNTAKDVSQWLHTDPKKIAVVPNGVESEFQILPSEIVNNWRQQYVNSPDEICILNVGSTHQRKNIETVLKVVGAIADEGIPVRLWKIGDDFTTEQKQFIRDRSLDKYITFLGKPNREALIGFYNAADVMLAPSLYEGFGLTILEAMACGTPVITSNVSSLPEVAGNAAVLVDPLNITAIVNAILQIKNDATFRNNLVEQGLERAKLFTWKNSAEKVASVYEQVIF